MDAKSQIKKEIVHRIFTYARESDLSVMDAIGVLETIKLEFFMLYFKEGDEGLKTGEDTSGS